MTSLLTPTRTAVLLLLGGWACAGSAQSLGTAAVDPLMGRPLEMTVPARFDGTDECVHADVFYGETRLAANRVRASVVGPREQRRIRVEADAPVDEPVVTVSLRAGCRNTVTRNYTLLPDYPSEALLAAADARSAMASAVPAVPLKMAKAAATPPRRAPDARAPAAGGGGTQVVAAARSGKPAPRALRPEVVAAAGHRLRLEPIDLPPVQALRVSTSLAQPQGDAAARATAALMWQAINADPQELLRASVRLQRLEQDLALLRQSTGQAHAEMAALRRQLEQARPWHASPALLQVLGLLVLAAAGAAGLLWYRTRGSRMARGDWYLPPETDLHDLPPVAEAPPAREVARVAVPAPVVAAPVTAPVRVPQAPVPEVVPADADPIAFDLPQPAAREAAPHAGEGALRVETLAATFEEVEFLASLDLGNDAMNVIKAYLQDSAQPAPVAYFELMRLCDQADDAVALATVRRRYLQAYGLEAPRLEQVSSPAGLEGLPALAARITRAWGRPEAAEAIEQALFEVPMPGMPITLQAARDLLFLHALATARAGTAPAPVEEAEAHPLAPWAHADDVQSASVAAQAAAEAQGGAGFGLDLDLTAAPPPPARIVEAEADLEFELEPIAPPAREPQRQETEDEEAFSAAMASERVPVSRY